MDANSRPILFFSAKTLEPLAAPRLHFNPSLGIAALRHTVAEHLRFDASDLRMAVAVDNALVEVDEIFLSRLPSASGVALRLFVLAGSGHHEPETPLINPASSTVESRVPFSFRLVVDGLEYARALFRKKANVYATHQRLAERAALFGLHENLAIDDTGHCQFDALADQLRRHTQNVNVTKESVRTRAVQWIRENANHDLGNDITLRQWIELEGRNIEEYCERMGRIAAPPGVSVEWGDEVTLFAICEAYRVSVLFLTSIEGGESYRMLYPRGFGPGDDLPQLCLGHLHELHYWSLVPVPHALAAETRLLADGVLRHFGDPFAHDTVALPLPHISTSNNGPLLFPTQTDPSLMGELTLFPDRSTAFEQSVSDLIIRNIAPALGLTVVEISSPKLLVLPRDIDVIVPSTVIIALPSMLSGHSASFGWLGHLSIPMVNPALFSWVAFREGHKLLWLSQFGTQAACVAFKLHVSEAFEDSTLYFQAKTFLSASSMEDQIIYFGLKWKQLLHHEFVSNMQAVIGDAFIAGHGASSCILLQADMQHSGTQHVELFNVRPLSAAERLDDSFLFDPIFGQSSIRVERRFVLGNSSGESVIIIVPPRSVVEFFMQRRFRVLLCAEMLASQGHAQSALRLIHVALSKGAPLPFGGLNVFRFLSTLHRQNIDVGILACSHLDSTLSFDQLAFLEAYGFDRLEGAISKRMLAFANPEIGASALHRASQFLLSLIPKRTSYEDRKWVIRAVLHHPGTNSDHAGALRNILRAHILPISAGQTVTRMVVCARLFNQFALQFVDPQFNNADVLLHLIEAHVLLGSFHHEVVLDLQIDDLISRYMSRRADSSVLTALVSNKTLFLNQLLSLPVLDERLISGVCRFAELWGPPGFELIAAQYLTTTLNSRQNITLKIELLESLSRLPWMCDLNLFHEILALLSNSEEASQFGESTLLELLHRVDLNLHRSLLRRVSNSTTSISVRLLHHFSQNEVVCGPHVFRVIHISHADVKLLYEIRGIEQKLVSWIEHSPEPRRLALAHATCIDLFKFCVQSFSTSSCAIVLWTLFHDAHWTLMQEALSISLAVGFLGVRPLVQARPLEYPLGHPALATGFIVRLINSDFVYFSSKILLNLGWIERQNLVRPDIHRALEGLQERVVRLNRVSLPYDPQFDLSQMEWNAVISFFNDPQEGVCFIQRKKSTREGLSYFFRSIQFLYVQPPAAPDVLQFTDQAPAPDAQAGTLIIYGHFAAHWLRITKQANAGAHLISRLRQVLAYNIALFKEGLAGAGWLAVAATRSPDVKAALAAVGAQLRGRGWSVRDVFFAEAGFEVGDTTLRRWTSTVDGSRPVTSGKKRSGAQAKLTEQREIATGWVLSADKKDAGFAPENVSFEQYDQEGYDYIVGLHNDGFFKHDPNLIWAVNFTSTAIKQQRYWTYGAKEGGKQQKYSKVAHVYTDNIFTAIALNGSIIEPYAFSHNPALMPGSHELDFSCQQYDINPSHVIYCPAAKNWVGETADMVYNVVKCYSWKNCSVIHDEEIRRPKFTEQGSPPEEAQCLDRTIAELARASSGARAHRDIEFPRDGHGLISHHLMTASFVELDPR